MSILNMLRLGNATIMTILDKVALLILMFIAYDLYCIPHALSFTAFAVFFGLRKGKRSNI